MSLSKITSYGTFSFLAGVGIVKLVRGREFQSENLENIRRLELAILATASGQYLVGFSISRERLQSWMYLDWLITTPMLLRTLHLLAVEKGFEGSFAPALSANLAMISLGYAAQFPERFNKSKDDQQFKWLMYSLSTASMLIIFYYVNKWNKFLISEGVDTGRLPGFFYYGWSVYAINFLNPDKELKQTTFNIMDAINKGFYSLELDRVLRKNF